MMKKTSMSEEKYINEWKPWMTCFTYLVHNKHLDIKEQPCTMWLIMSLQRKNASERIQETTSVSCESVKYDSWQRTKKHMKVGGDQTGRQ